MNTILIYWLIATSSSFAATGSVQFNDADSCEAARKAIIAQWNGPAGADAVCVTQGQVIVPVVAPPTPTVTTTFPQVLTTVPLTVTFPPAPTPAIPAVSPPHHP